MTRVENGEKNLRRNKFLPDLYDDKLGYENARTCASVTLYWRQNTITPGVVN